MNHMHMFIQLGTFSSQGIYNEPNMEFYKVIHDFKVHTYIQVHPQLGGARPEGASMQDI